MSDVELQAENDEFLATGEYDSGFLNWPGCNIIECMQNGTRAMQDALVAEFVAGLKSALSALLPLIAKEPDRALELVETFIAACYEKIEEVDESDGLGMFIQELFATWIRVRQSAKADPRETMLLLLDWWKNDDYGCCHDIEKMAVEALDRTGLAAFESVALEGRASERQKDTYERRWLSSVLRSIYLKQQNERKYLEITEETGLTPADCAALGEIQEKRKRFEDALGWVDRGLELEDQKSWGADASWGLAERRRELLTRVGRSAEALSDAWSTFEDHPSVHSFETLMRYVPRGQRTEWRERVVDVAEKTGLSTATELLVVLKQWDRLAGRVRKATVAALQNLSHYTSEPAANGLEEPHPDAAAKLFQAMAFRILDARKSKYYDAVLRNLLGARRCYLRAGLEKKWDDLVRYIRIEHRRKTSFMPGFEALLRGRLSTRAPSMVERARDRRRRQFGKLGRTSSE